MAPGPRISSKAALKEYVLRRLGAPVINIEITDEQLDDAISDTIEDFVSCAYSGVQEGHIPIQLIQGVYEYVLPYDVFAVLDLYSSNNGAMLGNGGSAMENPFHIKNYVASDLYASGVGKIDLVGYESIMMQLATINLLFQSKLEFSYNSHTKRLHLLSTNAATDKVILHCYYRIYPNETALPNPAYVPGGLEPQFIDYDDNNIFDIKWVKRMSVEKARYQWAINLSKYTGSTLPNGGQLNVDGILNEAKENIDKLKENLDLEYTLPPNFFIGALSCIMIAAKIFAFITTGTII